MVDYKVVTGFLGYRVGSDGSIWTRLVRDRVNVKLGEGLRLGDKWVRKYPKPNNRGYIVVTLFKDKTRYYKQLHRLILKEFKGDCPLGMQCRHLDGNRINNHVDNLCWGSSKENHKDRVRHGTNPVGARNGRAKLNPDVVAEIRRIYEQGSMSQSRLGAKFGINQTQVSRIILGRAWN